MMHVQSPKLIGHADVPAAIETFSLDLAEVEGIYGGIDPGWSAPTAVVVAALCKRGVLHVLWSFERARVTFREVMVAVRDSGFDPVDCWGLDPTCGCPHWQTGKSDEELMRMAGYGTVVSRVPRVHRLRLLRLAAGGQGTGVKLKLDPRAPHVIDALAEHRQVVFEGGVQPPATPKYAHVIDALSYLLVAIQRSDAWPR